MATVFDCRTPECRSAGLAAAAGALRAGRLVVVPTDTVYGVGADAFDAAAVGALLAAKQRGSDVPVPVLVGSWSTIDGLVLSVPPAARDLVEAFWPGPLSLVLPHAPSLSWDLGRTRGTVTLRMPLHPVALELLRECGPMAVSGANVVDRPPPRTVDEARDQLGDAVDVYLDSGPVADPDDPDPGATVSTVVDFTAGWPMVRRVGAVSIEELGEVLGTAPPIG